jgi:hypothetical protein
MDMRTEDATAAADSKVESAAAQPVRGPLKLEVTASSPSLEAGRNFSLLVTITNPFDIPVEIERVTTIAPVEFIDVERIRRQDERNRVLNQANQLAEEIFQGTSVAKTTIDAQKKKNIHDLVMSILRLIPFFGGFAEVAYNASQVITASSVSLADSSKEPVTAILDVERLKEQLEELESVTAGEEKAKLRARALKTLRSRIEELHNPAAPIILQPGDSVAQSFTLCTKRAILFPPSSYELPLQLIYKIAGVVHQCSFRHSISIRSPLKAVILGAMFGACAGFILKDVFQERAIVRMFSTGNVTDIFVWLVALIGNILLALIVVIAFARKRDTQPILSIEDFWGGLFIGAMTGYAGKAIVNQILIAPPRFGEASGWLQSAMVHFAS